MSPRSGAGVFLSCCLVAREFSATADAVGLEPAIRSPLRRPREFGRFGQTGVEVTHRLLRLSAIQANDVIHATRERGVPGAVAPGSFSGKRHGKAKQGIQSATTAVETSSGGRARQGKAEGGRAGSGREAQERRQGRP